MKPFIKYYLFQILFLMLTLLSSAQYGEWQWMKTGGDPSFSSCYLNDVATDRDNNVFFIAEFDSEMILGSDILSWHEGSSHFIAKCDSNGNRLWIKQFHTTSHVSFDEIVTDTIGTLFLTGYFEDTLIVDGFRLYAPGEYMSFVAGVDNSDGTVLWIIPIKEDGSMVSVRNLCVADDQGIYITGYYQSDTLFIGDSVITKDTTEISNLFLTFIDSYGIVQWVVQAASKKDIYGLKVCSDPDGNCILLGAADTTFTLDDTTHYIEKPNQTFLAWYNPSGTLDHSRIIPADEYIYVADIECDGSGNAFVYGKFTTDSLTIDSIAVYSHSYFEDCFMAKFQPSGKTEWIQTFGGPYYNSPKSLYIDSDGTSYISGSYRIDWFYDLSLNFFASFDPSGSYRYDMLTNMKRFTRDNSGNFIGGGEFQGTKRIADTSYTSIGYQDIFVGKRDSISSNLPLSVTYTTTPVNGIEEIAGTISFYVSGGMEPYSFIYGLSSGTATRSYETPGTRSVIIYDRLGHYTDTLFTIVFDSTGFDLVNDEYRTLSLDNYSITANGHTNMLYCIWDNADTNLTHPITSYGEHTVMARFNSGYQVYDTLQVIYGKPGITNQNITNPLLVYPNPAHDILKMNCDKSMKINLMIYSSDGKFIKESNSNEIIIRELKPGTYYGYVTIEGKTKSFKFVKY